MITLKKAILFSRYEGNIELWLEHATIAEKSIFSEGDWSEIESVVDEIGIAKTRQERELQKVREENRTFTPIPRVPKDSKFEFDTKKFQNIAEDQYEMIISELWKSA